MYIKGSNVSQDKQTANPSKYPQGWFKDKPCKRCGTVFSPKAPSHLFCCEECRRLTNSEKYYVRTYNITLPEWAELFDKQNGVCAICLEEGFIMKEDHVAKLMVDHDHRTLKVRGLLCHNCNRALGLLKDSRERLLRAADYVQ